MRGWGRWQLVMAGGSHEGGLEPELEPRTPQRNHSLCSSTAPTAAAPPPRSGRGGLLAAGRLVDENGMGPTAHVRCIATPTTSTPLLAPAGFTFSHPQIAK